MGKVFIHLDEALKRRDPNKASFDLLTQENGCMAGCKSGITITNKTEFGKFGVHDDQEGFYVLEGEGYAHIGDEEFEIFPGTSFIALPGVEHGIISKSADKPVKVFWFHSAI